MAVGDGDGRNEAQHDGNDKNRDICTSQSLHFFCFLQILICPARLLDSFDLRGKTRQLVVNTFVFVHFKKRSFTYPILYTTRDFM